MHVGTGTFTELLPVADRFEGLSPDFSVMLQFPHIWGNRSIHRVIAIEGFRMGFPCGFSQAPKVTFGLRPGC